MGTSQKPEQVYLFSNNLRVAMPSFWAKSLYASRDCSSLKLDGRFSNYPSILVLKHSSNVLTNPMPGFPLASVAPSAIWKFIEVKGGVAIDCHVLFLSFIAFSVNLSCHKVWYTGEQGQISEHIILSIKNMSICFAA